MKKSLIAGAGIAALGLAVVPFAGVFAEDSSLTATVTDNLNITVEPTCLFTQSANAGASGWEADSGNTYTKALGINQQIDEVETTHMRVICNDAKGYKVTASEITDLTGPETTSTTGTNATNATIPFGTKAVTAGTSSWTAYRSNSLIGGITDGKSFYITKTGDDNTVLSSTKPTNSTIDTNKKVAGDTVDIKYSVATSASQAAGTYTGHITYTLTAASLTKKSE